MRQYLSERIRYHYIKKLYTTIIKDSSKTNSYWVPTDVITLEPSVPLGGHAMYYDLLSEIMVSNSKRKFLDFNKFVATTFIKRNGKGTIEHVPNYVHYQRLELTDTEASAFNVADGFYLLTAHTTPMSVHGDDRKAILHSLLKSQLEKQVGSIGTHPLSRRYIKSYGQISEDPNYRYKIQEQYRMGSDLESYEMI